MTHTTPEENPISSDVEKSEIARKGVEHSDIEERRSSTQRFGLHAVRATTLSTDFRDSLRATTPREPETNR